MTGPQSGEAAFSRLQHLLRITARELRDQKRPFDIPVSEVPAPASGVLGRLIMPWRKKQDVPSRRGWRLHSMRLTESSAFRTSTSAGAGTVRYTRTEEALWLDESGTLFRQIIKFERQGLTELVAVESADVNYLSAARYDYQPTWRTGVTLRGQLRVEEGWLEILGKPLHDEPFSAITTMLSRLTTETAGPLPLRPD